MNTQFVYMVIDALAKALNSIYLVSKDGSTDSMRSYKADFVVLSMINLQAFKRYIEKLSDPNKVLVHERFKLSATIDDGTLILPLKEKFSSILHAIDLAQDAMNLMSQETYLNQRLSYFAEEVKK